MACSLGIALGAGACSGGGDAAPPTTSAAVSAATTSAPPTTASNTSAASPTPTAPAGDAFYTPPDPLPAGGPGTLVRSREIPAPPGAKGWLIMYLSRNASGMVVAVTGTVFTPLSAPATAMLAWAHGTTGLGDQCAPSKATAAGTGPDRLLAQAVLAQGLVFVATDYEGLGTPGVHTYVVGLSEGRAVLDSIRAARQLLSLAPTTKAVVWGHSQGGGAALWAAELEPTYAPDANVVGVAAGAPAVELLTLGQRMAATDQFAFQLLAVAGFHAAYPDLPLAAILTADGEAAVEAAGSQCLDATFAATRGQSASRYFQPNAATSAPWDAVFDENSPGSTRTDVPIFIYQGDADEIIPVELSATVAQKYCANGVVVDRKEYPGANHVGSVTAALGDLLAYLQGRLAGQPPPSTC